MTDAAAGATWFMYDAKDHLKTVQDPRGLTTTYTYNGLGDLVTQASPDTGTTSFTYDSAGNVATQTDARSVVTTYTYDALNRVLAATVTDGTVTYEYDNVTTGGPGAKGRLTMVTDPSGSTRWAYDLLGRVTSKTQVVGTGGGAKTFITLYSYTAGLLTGITYPSGRVLAIGHDLQGQAASLASDGVTILSGGLYFPFGGARKWTWGNGEVFERFFDLDGRITGVTLGPSAGMYADLDQAFGYDALDRLTSAAVAAGQTLGFAYDANGNRTSTTVNGGSTTTYSYPGASHKLSSLSGATARSFAYDLAGNVTSSAGITYVYDGRGRMKQAGATTYLVNGLGQRVRKSAGTDTHFAYDEAGRLLGEYDAAGAAIQEYVWLGDTPVAIMRPAAPSGTNIYYEWADNLGTPRAVSDTSNVLRWEWLQANPFGASAPNENPAGAGAFNLNLRFPGQYFDAETGLHYNYFRDYDPAIGRYVQSDPIGLRGGINTYGYVTANPLNRTDPAGLFVGGIHYDVTFQAMNRECRTMASEVSDWSVVADQVPNSQDPDPRNTRRHAMAAVGQSPSDAIDGWRDFIAENLNSCSVKGLGLALHAVQDSYSPSHSGFQTWHGVDLGIIVHGAKDLFPNLFSPGSTQHATDASERLIRDFKKRCPCKC